LLVTIALVFLLFTASSEIAVFFTDYLWFDSLDLREVWAGTIGAKWQLIIIFTTVLTAVLWFNLYLAERRAPLPVGFGPDEVFGRYQDVLDRRSGVLRVSIALAFGLIGGINFSGTWQEWLLFRNGSDFNRVDATFGRDIGFYVFQLPFWKSLVNWAFGWALITLLVTGLAYYINGGIRPHLDERRVSLAAKRHLSMILVVILLLKAADYWFERYELVFSTRSRFNGATYTPVNAELPAIQLLMAAAVITAILVAYSSFRRGFTLPVVSVGAWFLVSIVAGVAYPFVVQATEVAPNESAKERPYIENNMAATRDALGLTTDRVERRQFDYKADRDIAAQAIEDNPGTIRNVSILDPEKIRSTFQNQQGTQSYYRFADLDADRYLVTLPDGRQVASSAVVGTRTMSYNAVQASWENKTIVYTHGYGAALTTASGVGQGGGPDYLVTGVPMSVDASLDLGHREAGDNSAAGGAPSAETPKVGNPSGDPSVFEPGIYFGELAEREDNQYVVVGATRDEISYVSGPRTEPTRYKGKGGVQLDNFLTRAAFSLRYRDTQLLLSSYITDESRILFERDVRGRVQRAAPFITWDSNPYPVIANGRVVYLIDGYTTTPNFPNAQRMKWEQASDGSGDFNYVRNSVKATVDAYDGTIRMYAWDATDPILAAYGRAFPSLFKNVDEMPSEVRDHVRYPEALFRVQTREWGRYRLNSAEEFFQASGAWSISDRPSEQPQQATTTSTTRAVQFQNSSGTTSSGSDNPIDPTYALLRIPGDTKETFNLTRSFSPFQVPGSSVGQQNLSGFMYARSDRADYGKLIEYEMPSNTTGANVTGVGNVSGPTQVDNVMTNKQEVSTLLTQLNQQGSLVDFGAMQMVPVGEHSIIWVRPIYVRRDGRNTPSAFPVLSNVVVAFGDQVVMKPTFREALQELFGRSIRVDTFETGGGIGGGDPSNGGTTTQTTSGTGGTTTTSTTGAGGTSTSIPGGGSTSSTSSTSPGGGGDAVQLIAEANRLLAEAQAAYDVRDLTTYLKLVDQASEKIREADRLLSAEANPPDGGVGVTTTVPVPPA